MYSCILSKNEIIFSSFAISVIVLYSVQVLPAVFLIYFISAAVILLASLALVVQFSLPYIKAGMANVLYNFIPKLFEVFCRLNILFIMPLILN